MQTATSIEIVLRAAVEQNLLGADVPVAGFIDVAGVRASAEALHSAFQDAPSVLHTFAVKANPLVAVITLLAAAGLGCEVASPGELAIALAAGVPPERIVLDSPAKTVAELRHGLALGLALNVDNFQELARVDKLIADRSSSSVIGLRINPQVGTGSIGYMSTATATSKFGIALGDPGARRAIVNAFAERPWLTSLHAHVGSQGCPLELIAAGIKAVYELAEQINAELGRQQVISLDLGGGLPVNFTDEDTRPSFGDYVAVLRQSMPELLDGRYRLITEFGRSLLAKNGMMVANVEYTKDSGGNRIALSHAGAQVATRTVFMPEAWPLRISAYDRTGAIKHAPMLAQDLGGPLCFAGDLVARGRLLPELEPDDLLVLHDTGAYYFSSPWTYNSLPSPAVYGYRTVGTDVRFDQIRAAQSLSEVVAANGLAFRDALL